MTILHTETLARRGGQQNRILTEAVGLSKRGHKIIIVCHRGRVLAKKAKAAGIKLYELNMVKHRYLINVPKLIRIIRKEGVGIISTHSSVDSWAAGIAARLTDQRLIRFRHNLSPIGNNPLTRFIYAMSDRIIVPRNAVKDVFIKRKLDNKKITVIPDLVDTKTFISGVKDLRKELRIPGETTVIGNTSSFTPVKGQKYLLQAFNIIYEKFPCILLFAGRLNEPFRSRYLSYVREDLREKVIFLGHREDIPRVLMTIDIAVFPAVAEGLGTALLEAMAMEKPVVVSEISTFKEFIRKGVNGLFFKSQNPESLSEKVVFLMQNKDLRQQLIDNARATVLEKFSSDKILNETEGLYNKVLSVQ